MAVSFKRSNDCCKELLQVNAYLRATIIEQAARIKALEDALRVSKSTLNLVRNEGYNLPGSSITYALGKINELIGE